MDPQEKRNLFIAVILTTLIFMGWNYFFEPKNPLMPQNATQTSSANEASKTAASLPPAPVSREVALQSGRRVTIDTPKLQGSINLKGARFDDLTLRQYHTKADTSSPLEILLNPAQTTSAYFGEFGWLSDKKSMPLPDADTIWQADRTTLKPGEPVTLTWDNGAGLVFQQVIAVDENYLFTVTQKVTNKGGDATQVRAHGVITRHGTPATSGFFILHEGPLGYLNDKLVEIDYKDLQEKPEQAYTSKGGWLGLTDKYWLTAFIPDQKADIKVTYADQAQAGTDIYKINFQAQAMDVAPNSTVEMTNHFFAGAKVLSLLDGYEEKLGVKHFDLAVDFGWFYFLTKPLFSIITHAHNWFGNFGLAIIFLTIVLKLLFFPLANKSYRSMARMKALQPEIQKIQTRWASDKLRMNQELMDFYKKQEINPLGGCLPMLIQIPVFFALYKVLFVTIEMRHAPFYGWIHDLSAPDPTSVFNLFGLIPWDPPSILHLGAWPLMMGITMVLQQRLSPQPADPAQAKMMMIMPIMFTIMCANFPAGLVIYWSLSNLMTIGQQWALMRLEAKRPVHVPAKKGKR